jgi:hypothetical protein
MTDDKVIPADMMEELDKFDGIAEQIIASFVQGVELQPPPPVIYHYTNDLGFRGILESGKFWLTDIFNLNDPSELTHGFSHAIRILNGRAANGPPESQLFAQQFAIFGLQGGIQAAAHYFVCSFSASGDDLGQWRAYADNGRGYALGFDTKALEDPYTKIGDTPIPNNSTFSLTYNDAQLSTLHARMIDAMFHLISLPRGRTLGPGIIPAYMQHLSISLTMHALRAVLFFKHEAYRNEQEYRFLQVHRADVPPPEVKVRGRPYSLIRYREFDWKAPAPEALRRIVVGPAADFEKASQFARDCLKTFHSGTVEIVRSEIPYRAP